MVVIKTLGVQEQERWDRFVETCDEATFFHRAGWKTVIETSTGHTPYYLYAEQDGHICGVLPLVEVKSRLFGHALVSTPFCVYGGVASTCEAATSGLLDHAQSLAEKLRVDYLELRHRQVKTRGWPVRSTHATFRRPLGDDDSNLKAMKRKQRAVIRQAIGNEHTAAIEPDLDRFFHIYSTSVRNLGTPVFSRRFFKALQAVFKHDCEVLSVHHQGRPVCSLMSFYFRDEVLPYYGGGLPESRSLKSMDFMYWDLMQRATTRGIGIYDFGRSKIDSGPYHYKRHWGFVPEPLCYEYHLVRATQLPNHSPSNPKYRYFIKLWQRLPLWLTQQLGPYLSKNLA
ncbi:FemAB family XrtA/PEP-CTERM system-associated protein [Marinobacterium aestuariivivens]|uniref:FemAB family XrtA/PEP-CTERM system-associated protein n=1 Tax=Marinobacterium aestuariivivens TaxID=1698799 RepID=A0ABW1ZTF8_9GAMM